MELPQLENLLAGARNLLVNCMQAQAEDRIVVLHESPDLGHYDSGVIDAVRACTSGLGLNAKFLEVPFFKEDARLTPEVQATMRGADRTVFLARLGDQLRFTDFPEGARATVCYALSEEMLGSRFGTAHHDAFEAIKTAIGEMAASSREIRVTCPLGTNFSGPGGGFEGSFHDVRVNRFPMLVSTPILAKEFSGTVALPKILAGTGSRYYTPFGLELAGVLHARFRQGQLVGFYGRPEDVATAEKHYDFVSRRFGIDRNFVHSWHVGIHPGMSYPRPAAENYERWSASAFGNPRLLHFHTCGAYAPGEISWNILDPTCSFDGVDVWEHGRLLPRRIPSGTAILDRFPCAREVFENPAQEVGI